MAPNSSFVYIPILFSYEKSFKIQNAIGKNAPQNAKHMNPRRNRTISLPICAENLAFPISAKTTTYNRKKHTLSRLGKSSLYLERHVRAKRPTTRRFSEFSRRCFEFSRQIFQIFEIPPWGKRSPVPDVSSSPYIMIVRNGLSRSFAPACRSDTTQFRLWLVLYV